MHIFITGATGFIGSNLITKLLNKKYKITALVRNISRAKLQLPNIALISNLTELENFDQFDAVINLAGEPIFDHRWSQKQKNKLQNSRVQLTQQLTQLINKSTHPPQCFISGSAIGYYGNRPKETLTEEKLKGCNFTADLCQLWEEQALQANTRVCVLRTGIVLDPTGGAFSKMLPLYRLGLGGKLGNGEQYWSWIALEDMINAIIFLLETPSCHGVFNMVAPNPVRNKTLNSLLGKYLHRPTFCTVPAFAMRIILGERADLLFDDQKVFPKKLILAGFNFQYAILADYLAKTL